MTVKRMEDGSEWVPLLYNVIVFLRNGSGSLEEIRLPKVTGMAWKAVPQTLEFEGIEGKAVFYERDVAAYIMKVIT